MSPSSDAAEGDLLDDPLGGARVHVQVHAGVVAAEARHQLRHERGVDGRGGGDGQLALVALLDLADGRAAGLDGLKASRGVRQQCLPSQRQPHAAPGSLEEARADLLLQGHDARAQGRLAEVQRARGSAHGPKARDFQERFQAGVVQRIEAPLTRDDPRICERRSRSRGSHNSIGHPCCVHLRCSR